MAGSLRKLRRRILDLSASIMQPEFGLSSAISEEQKESIPVEEPLIHI